MVCYSVMEALHSPRDVTFVGDSHQTSPSLFITLDPTPYFNTSLWPPHSYTQAAIKQPSTSSHADRGPGKVNEAPFPAPRNLEKILLYFLLRVSRVHTHHLHTCTNTHTHTYVYIDQTRWSAQAECHVTERPQENLVPHLWVVCMGGASRFHFPSQLPCLCLDCDG